MLKKVFLLVLAGVIIYSVATVYTPWFRNTMFQADLEELIKEVGIQTIPHVRSKVLFSARQNGIPVAEENIVTERDPATGMVTFEANYEVTVRLGGDTYVKVWRFNPKATRVVTLTPGTGTLF